MDVETLIRETDALVFFNALKVAIAELKEELATIDETRDYQNQAVDRARKIMRRIDNQYRAIVKSAQGLEPKEADNIDDDVVKLMEEIDGS